MKSQNLKAIKIQESNSKNSDLQKLYLERIERFMSLVELSYALKHSPKIFQNK